jgi:hypothetical protein
MAGKGEHRVACDIRHSVQTAYSIIILGAGPILAGLYNEWLDRFDSPSALGGNWPALWLTQAVIGAAMALLMRSRSARASVRTNPELPPVNWSVWRNCPSRRHGRFDVTWTDGEA